MAEVDNLDIDFRVFFNNILVGIFFKNKYNIQTAMIIVVYMIDVIILLSF